MGDGPPRGWALIGISLLLAGCSTTYTTHRNFKETYEKSLVVVIAPPRIDAYWMNRYGIQSSEELREAGFENLTIALESVFEARGLDVVWVEENPVTAPCIATVWSAFDALLPELDKEVVWVPWEEPKEYFVEDAGLLIDAFGGDLLILAEGISFSDSSDLMKTEARLHLFTFGLTDRHSPYQSLRFAIIDRNGLLVAYSPTTSAGSLANAKATASAVGGAFAQLPKLYSPRAKPVEAPDKAAARAARQDSARRVLAVKAEEAALAAEEERARQWREWTAAPVAPERDAYWKCVARWSEVASVALCQREMLALQAACDAAKGYNSWEECKGVPPR